MGKHRAQERRGGGVFVGVVGATMLAHVLAQAPAASAEPIVIGPNSIEVVEPDISACDIADPTLKQNVACATALTNEFRGSEGLGPVPDSHIVTSDLPGELSLIPSIAYGTEIGQVCPIGEYLGPNSCAEGVWYPANITGELSTAAVIVSEGHEGEHPMQYARGDNPVNTAIGAITGLMPAEENQLLEAQADCVSGANVRFNEKQGYMTEEEVTEARDYLVSIGQADTPNSTHPTGKVRGEAFGTGYEGGLAACDTMVLEVNGISTDYELAGGPN